MNTSAGWSSLSCAIARVTQVFWEDMRVSIRVITGEDSQPPIEGVEIYSNTIGSRHFLGAMPTVGDYCICAWFVQNTNAQAGQKTPAIIGWLPRTTFLGHDWLPMQDFSAREGTMNTPKERREAKAVVNRKRHKLRHMEPGNIVASSSQGSDLILDESATLVNRRLNEVRLRDQDQALITRSVQQFQTMAGARIYGGLVQRDARSLPQEMRSSSIVWDSDTLFDEEGDFFFQENTGDINKLSPHPMFSSFDGTIPPNLNPSKFLYKSGLVSQSGDVISDDGFNYGGKSILHINKKGEALGAEELEALVEYRIEVNNTSDGSLPVTEQTDGFDADRLLDVKNQPIAELVLGSVVGNDPKVNVDTYGVPLAISNDGDLSFTKAQDEKDQLAYLVKVNPVKSGSSPSFSTITKNGEYRARVSSRSEESAVVQIDGGARITTEQLLNITGRFLSVETTDGLSLSTDGSISLSAKGATYTDNEQTEVDRQLRKVGIQLESPDTVALKSQSAFVVSAPRFIVENASSIEFGSQSNLSFRTADNIETSTKTQKTTVTGKSEYIYSGPTDFNPLSGPARDIIVGTSPATGFVSGVADKYTLAYGDREESYPTTSKVTKTITAGENSSDVGIGKNAMSANGNSVEITPAGVSIKSSGLIDLKSGGAMSLSSGAAINITAGASVKITGSTVVLSAPTAVFGPILCGLDREPMTNLPFASFGLVTPRGQTLANA